MHDCVNNYSNQRLAYKKFGVVFTKLVNYAIITNNTYIGRQALEIIRFFANDVLELKKPHPCGSNRFRVIRVGGVVRLECLGCGRDMTLDRIKLEKNVKRVISGS